MKYIDFHTRCRPGRLARERFVFGTDTAGANFVTRRTELMKEPFFAPHTEDFFYNNAAKLFDL